MRAFASLALGFVLLTLAACARKGNGPNSSDPGGDVAPPSNGVNAFSDSPIEPALADTITPLGNLIPPGHMLAANHAYIYSLTDA